MSSLLGAGISNVVTLLTRWMLTPPSLPDLARGRFDDYGRWESRSQRYDVFWSFYSNTAYQNSHAWSSQFKTLYGLYRYTRGCYNPLFRLGELWSRAIWPGKLEHRQLAGRVIQSAAPILTDSEEIREAIGKLWKDSDFQSSKDTISRLGAVMGDVGFKVEDDTKNGQVRIVPVHPGTIRWIKMDRQRRVLAYELWEYRWDPRYNPKTMDPRSPGAGEQAVLYIEKAELLDPDGRGGVRYQTFLNYLPHGWDGNPEEWVVEDYPEIPFVLHAQMPWIPGYYWGLSEYQAALTKCVEVDDLGSKHHDQIRKASDPKWFLAGVQRPRNETELMGADPSTQNPQPGRQELPFLYGSMGATAVPMVFPLDNQFVSVETQNQLHAIEQDYPELRYDAARISGDASAKALREIRKTAEQKVHSRRSGYDNDLVKAHKIALAIGGQRGYPGYNTGGLGWAAYADGGLDHTIGDRTVFLLDPLDRIEEEDALYSAWQKAKLAGVPDKVIMERLDWSPAEIQSYLDSQKEEQQQALDQQVKLTSAATPAPTSKNSGSSTDQSS